MLPRVPDPQEWVDANLRRAYRGTLPETLPDRLAALLTQLAAKTAPRPGPMRPPAPASRSRFTGLCPSLRRAQGR